MQASQERISSLCSSLGTLSKSGQQYSLAEHYEVAFNELGYSIWHDDEVTRPVNTQVYELGIFKNDLIPALLLGGTPGRLALMNLTAITYPPRPNCEEYEKHISILQSYQFEVSLQPGVVNAVLDFASGMVERPDSNDSLLQPAELAFTFIRNIVVIPCDISIHDRLFAQLNDACLFEIIDSIRLVRLGDRCRKFARLICGILYGCFSPFLPLTCKSPPIEVENSLLAAAVAEQRRKPTRMGSRHGHWGSAITVKSGSGKGYTFSGAISLTEKVPLPDAKHLRIRARPIDLTKPTPIFTIVSEEAATRILGSRAFPDIFEFAFPKTFNGYDPAFTVREQLQLADMARFFMDFSVKFGTDLRAVPLGTPNVIAYFQSMALFWMDWSSVTIQGISALTGMQTVCRLLASLADYLCLIIQDCRRETDIQMVCDVVSHCAGDWENVLIAFLAQKNLTKKSFSMLRDNIVAIERLYKLYRVAQSQSLVRVRATPRDEDANPDADGPGSRINEKFDIFNADFIVTRLTKKADILTPFFILLDHIDHVDDEGICAIARMLDRFTSKVEGMARLWRLPFFYVINKLWNDSHFQRRQGDAIEQLNNVFAEIVRKFCETARHDRTIMVQIIGVVDPDDIYDEEAIRQMQEAMLMEQIGISPEVLSMLTPRTSQKVNSEDEEPSRILLPPNLPLPIQKKKRVTRKPKVVLEEEPEPPPPMQSSDDDDSSEEQLSFEQLRAARVAAEKQRVMEQRRLEARAQVTDDEFEFE
jgi:hypothetical protein